MDDTLRIFPVMSLLQEFCILLLGAGWGAPTHGFCSFWFLSWSVECGSKCRAISAMKLKSELLFDYGYMTCDLPLFAHSSSSPKKIHKRVVDYSTDRPFTHLALSINLISTFCNQFQLFALKNFSFLDCLGLIDVLSANERA